MLKSVGFASSTLADRALQCSVFSCMPSPKKLLREVKFNETARFQSTKILVSLKMRLDVPVGSNVIGSPWFLIEDIFVKMI